jgi:predicted RecB family nuclease
VVEGLSRAQARKLRAAGIRDAAALAGSDPRDVAAALALRDRAKATALVEAAKRLSRPP